MRVRVRLAVGLSDFRTIEPSDYRHTIGRRGGGGDEDRRERWPSSWLGARGSRVSDDTYRNLISEASQPSKAAAV